MRNRPWHWSIQAWRPKKNRQTANWVTLRAYITCESRADAEFIGHELDMFLDSLNHLMENRALTTAWKTPAAKPRDMSHDALIQALAEMDV